MLPKKLTSFVENVESTNGGYNETSKMDIEYNGDKTFFVYYVGKLIKRIIFVPYIEESEGNLIFAVKSVNSPNKEIVIFNNHLDGYINCFDNSKKIAKVMNIKI